MEAKFKGSKTSKEQSIEQALRRLKYLHTSLVPHEAFSTHHGHQVDERILTTKGLQSTSEERFKRTRRTSEKQCFLSLQPKASRPPGEKTKSRVVSRKQDKKAIRTGRAPLQTYRVSSSASMAEEQLESKNENVIISRDAVARERTRTSKSASSALCTSDPHRCLHCFQTNGFGDNTRNKKVTKEYFTNMRINRVTFSARPSSNKVKSVHESKIEIPKSCFFNGWGVRSKKEHSARENASNDSKRHTTKGTIDVTVGLKTLRLEPKRVQQGYAGETIPQPPPTPVRQIDIRLPQGVLLKYQLSEDE